MTVLRRYEPRLEGTTAERTAFSPTAVPTYWWDTDDTTLYVWDGAAWVDALGGGSVSSAGAWLNLSAGVMGFYPDNPVLFDLSTSAFTEYATIQAAANAVTSSTQIIIVPPKKFIENLSITAAAARIVCLGGGTLMDGFDHCKIQGTISSTLGVSLRGVTVTGNVTMTSSATFRAISCELQGAITTGVQGAVLLWCKGGTVSGTGDLVTLGCSEITYTGSGAWTQLDQPASATVKGIVELATDAEVQTGTDATRAVTPAGLRSLFESASPGLEFHNTTEEDIDGGRETVIEIRGEQSGGEETALAQIEVSHEGTADDEKGRLIIYINDGNDGDAPTEVLRIDSAGNVGIGTTTPGEKIEISGNIAVHNTVADVKLYSYRDSVATHSRILTYAARGSVGSPAAIQSGDLMFNLSVIGYHSGGAYGGEVGYLGIHAAENFTSSAQGTYMTFFTTPIGGATRQERMRIDAAGNVGIGTTTPAASALLELSSTTGALLLPRMTTAQRNALTAVNGMVIYNTTTGVIEGYEGGAWVNL